MLADSPDRIFQERLGFGERAALFARKKAAATVTVGGAQVLAAHAQSPGFETYRTGWHSLILERVGR